MTKILIGPGSNGEKFMSTVEIVDIDKLYLQCDDFTTYPKALEGAFGGLRCVAISSLCTHFLYFVVFLSTS
jgi:hypothetical protein